MLKSFFIRTLAILLLAQSFLPRTAMDLLRSSDVWAHYREHRQEQQQPLSFLDFLWMHYAADSEHTKQKKHHLPSFDFNGVTGFFVLPSANVSFEITGTTVFFHKPDFQWLNSYAFLSFKALICPPRA
ncbi:hypothetical protein [Runella sp.]|uniref:hypothetical protein n=1 Tax=Runella sp. TaxID=1960881 RepID=UPI003D0BA099